MNGYKQAKFSIFGDLADLISKKIKAGIVVSILSPKALKFDPKYGISYSFDNIGQFSILGYSEDITFCDYSRHGQSCNQYLNKKFERTCERHR